MKKIILFLFILVAVRNSYGQLTIDHNHTDITTLTETDITQAKSNLHIVYGHTSHGSQLTTGMDGLVIFANNGGRGLNLPTDIFKWNNGGLGGALDLHDGGMEGDVGYYPQWYDNTISYLNNAANSDVNVVMWSWCGQINGKYAAGVLFSEYLEPMAHLEELYPNVIFVYMTGHLDHWDDANNKAANQMVRDYCIQNDKILYDFADIESYNPDNSYFQYAGDDCSYYSSTGTYLGNWAVEWRADHTENIDWYNCSSAHSDSLNANQKAYAAWHLFSEVSKIIFQEGIITLTINSSGASGISISATPPIYSGLTDYSYTGITPGISITLMAPSTSGSANFSNWYGCDSISSRSCTVTITESKTLSVDYTNSTVQKNQLLVPLMLLFRDKMEK